VKIKFLWFFASFFNLSGLLSLLHCCLPRELKKNHFCCTYITSVYAIFRVVHGVQQLIPVGLVLFVKIITLTILEFIIGYSVVAKLHNFKQFFQGPAANEKRKEKNFMPRK